MAGAGRARLRRRIGEGGLLGGGRPGGDRAIICLCAQTRVGSALVSLKRRRAPAVDRSSWPPTSCSGWCGPVSPSAGRCCGGHWPGWHPGRGVFVEAGIDEQVRAEQLSVADWGRLAAAIAVGARGASSGDERRAPGHEVRQGPEVLALAKLTLSLRVTGVRPDGTTFSTPRWSPSTWPTRFLSRPATAWNGWSTRRPGPAGMARCRPTAPTSSPAPCALTGRQGARPSGQAHPRRGRARRRVGRCRRCVAMGRG